MLLEIREAFPGDLKPILSNPTFLSQVGYSSIQDVLGHRITTNRNRPEQLFSLRLLAYKDAKAVYGQRY